ncbi:hypothetical protein ZIOFF_031963 [Zingiber officinale]|uniref:Uncharacterized protein n=1 Tax=Zingiber officinale TaxID=94328 RepID=A0A8J5GFY0_ZINOF|nr:hypothetical protein ZIOFF_031963 [Zingiber officinale]
MSPAAALSPRSVSTVEIRNAPMPITVHPRKQPMSKGGVVHSRLFPALALTQSADRYPLSCPSHSRQCFLPLTAFLHLPLAIPDCPLSLPLFEVTGLEKKIRKVLLGYLIWGHSLGAQQVWMFSMKLES